MSQRSYLVKAFFKQVDFFLELRTTSILISQYSSLIFYFICSWWSFEVTLHEELIHSSILRWIFAYYHHYHIILYFNSLGASSVLISAFSLANSALGTTNGIYHQDWASRASTTRSPAHPAPAWTVLQSYYVPWPSPFFKSTSPSSPLYSWSFAAPVWSFAASTWTWSSSLAAGRFCTWRWWNLRWKLLFARLGRDWCRRIGAIGNVCLCICLEMVSLLLSINGKWVGKMGKVLI